MSLIGNTDFEHFCFGAISVGGEGMFVNESPNGIANIYKFGKNDTTVTGNITDNEEVNSDSPSKHISDKKITISRNFKSTGIVTCERANEFIESVYDGGTIYVWGANYQEITSGLIESLYNTFKDSKHDYNYYQSKLAYAGRMGADCSGMFYPLSRNDMSANSYYHNYSNVRGEIAAIDTSRPAQLFRVGSNGRIVHTGWYNGNDYTIEMSNNCEKKQFNKSKWTFWSVPKWLDYDSWKAFGR